MKINALFEKNIPTLSFEVFPPKSNTNYDNVIAATSEIAKLSPDFMSVTCGAGGKTDIYTAEIAARLIKDYSVPSIAHMTCVGTTKENAEKRIKELESLGVENILALRGDIPDGFDTSTLEYKYASDLILDIKKAGDFCIGGACYPEGHPDSLDTNDDLSNLKKKVDAGCDYLTTQMFFDNNIHYKFLYKAREKGITCPIVPGIMPITNATQVERAIKLSGTIMPQRFLSIVDRFRKDKNAMMQAGIAYATDQIIDLFANGINHVHVYSMNKPEVARAILNNLSHIVNC